LLPHGLIQSNAAFDLVAELANEGFQSGDALAAIQNVKGLQQGHTRMQQRGELARELGDVTRGYTRLGVEANLVN
jgi:hypothetical protein